MDKSERNKRKFLVMGTASRTAETLGVVALTTLQKAEIAATEPEKLPEARYLFQEVVKMGVWPYSHWALNLLGFYSSSTVEAEDYYVRALELNPNYPEANFHLANLLANTKRVQESVEFYLTAVRVQPDFADAHYHLAQAYLKLDERSTALRHFLEYQRHGGEDGRWQYQAAREISQLRMLKRPAIVSDRHAREAARRRKTRLFKRLTLF